MRFEQLSLSENRFTGLGVRMNIRSTFLRSANVAYVRNYTEWLSAFRYPDIEEFDLCHHV